MQEELLAVLHLLEVLKLSYICRTINLSLISLDSPGVNIYIVCVLIFVYVLIANLVALSPFIEVCH